MVKLDFQPKLFSTLKNYTKTDFTTDLMAGIIVGIVALPLAIAFGIASGVSPEKGIITAIVAGFIISFLGGSKVQIGGPTGAFIVIIYGIIQEYGIEGLMVATMMAGVLLILLGIFKLGTIIKFIPYPIIVGFTSGIAVTIFTTQIADIFGLQFGGEKVPGDFIGKWILYFHHFDTVNWWNVIVSLVSIFIIAITPKFSKKIPGSLVAIILVTVGVYLLKMYGGITCIDTIGDRFSIKAQLPEAAVPALDRNFAYLSSGTWSLMGVETDAPVINEETEALNFTNEGGVAGTIRLLKNICGMWLLERCRCDWEEISYPELIAEAEACEPFRSLINPDDVLFANPMNMEQAIRTYCADHHQPIPETRGQIVRCIFESLSLRYRQVLENLCSLSPRPVEVLHVIGGGSRNDLLNQWTANAVGIPVVAGPSEATAIGNVMIQALTAGAASDIVSMRQLINRSIPLKTFTPENVEVWNTAYLHFLQLA